VLVPHPLPNRPKVVAVDRLAFYQPGTFGESGGQIEFMAPVRGYELTTRAELLRDEPEHPRAREEYFKIQLGPLERLAHPVSAEKWRRLTFLYTTGEYLLKARSLNDLVVQSDERQLLWQSLRERATPGQTYQVDLPEAEIPPEVLAALLGLRKSIHLTTQRNYKMKTLIKGADWLLQSKHFLPNSGCG